MMVVTAGGAAGAVLRQIVSLSVARRLGHGALGTFAVNLSGCFLIGLAGGAVIEAGAQGATWLLLVTGVLGSYTTVSSFSVQTLALLREGRAGAALVNVAGSTLLCLSATATGFALSFSFGALP